ncbi:MAG: serine/threonine-protein kinase [bacterium]
MKIRPGTIIAEKYEVEVLLGQGGMGAVWRAKHLALGKTVAIKFLLAAYSQDPEYRVRFEREAQVAARLRHENVVAVSDFGTHDGNLFIVMDMLRGGPLNAIYEKGQGLPWKRVVGIGRQIADALATAHAMGLVHRDLKPENIMLERRSDGGDRPIIVDFSLAFVANDAELGRMTREGIVSGTPQFIAPEQAMGAPDIGPPADIYSFGCILYEMLTGDQVFKGSSTVQLLNLHMFVPPPSARVTFPQIDVPPALDALISTMLAKDPAERPDALEVRLWIDRLLENPTAVERGRPESLRGERAGRGVTLRLFDGAAGPSAVAPQHTVAVMGTMDDAVFVALRASGFELTTDVARAEVAILKLPDIETVKACPIPVLASVDVDNVDHTTELLKVGAADVIAHPIEPTDLVRKLQRLLRRLQRRERT